ncbi:metal-sensitive transcriptional regulator [Bacillus marinisedimentorum]|uniref:metal-sensitive transcriptional regulator n=1 Tax=Bacillus marinisedimentorum TaxID=1821260 RepID=UPI0007E010A3|nr:metal-sensitive transcriptional regulator [Bacillus marinisedimentorum]
MEYAPEVKNRLKRVEGQIRGIIRMMEDEKECKDVITQLTASRSALDRAMGHILGQNLQHCIVQQEESGEESSERVEEAINLLIRSR